MLYSRTFQNSGNKSKNILNKIFSYLGSWLGTSRFSMHLGIIFLTFFVFVFTRAVPYYSFEGDSTKTTDLWGEVDQFESENSDDEILDYQVSNEAIVKPYMPYTEESASRKPIEKSYIVQEGDNSAAIAEKFSITEKALLQRNSLTSSDSLEIGKELIVPIPKGMWYIIDPGDTVYTIAQQYDIDPNQIINNNDIVDPEGLAEGRRIVLPGVFPTAAPTAQPTKAVARSSGNQSSTKKTTNTTSNSANFSQGNARFGWPVNPGSVFQSQKFHSGHPGVDLASKGSRNVPIYAAAAGKVVFSGWSSRGYGKMIQIDHQNGYDTLYGHFYKIYVSYGEWVKKGQVLGLMGTTGHSTGVHLHFEICTNSCGGYSTSTRLSPRRFF